MDSGTNSILALLPFHARNCLLWSYGIAPPMIELACSLNQSRRWGGSACSRKNGSKLVWLEKYPDFKSVTLLQRFNTPFDLIITLSLIRSIITDNSSRHFPPNTRLHGGRRHNVVCCIYLPGVKYRMFRNGGEGGVVSVVTGFGVRERARERVSHGPGKRIC